VKHGAASDIATVAIAGEISELTVRIEVVNAGDPFEARPGGVENREPGGRGLFLVDRLSRAWGTDCDEGHTTVWFEMSRDAAPTRSVLSAD
jgi:hypothetical protein